MQPKEILAAFPEQMRASSGRPDVLYFKQRGCAVHHRPHGAPAPGAALVLNEGEIAMYLDDPPPTELHSPGVALTPVYSQRPAGSPAVPTGLVCIRFREGISPETRQRQIVAAGYEIAQCLAYAPNTAWLRARSGSAAEALHNLSLLEQLPDVENVEPQMLREWVART